MQDAFNKEDDHLTVLNLSGAEPQQEAPTKSKSSWRSVKGAQAPNLAIVEIRRGCWKRNQSS